MGYDTTMNSNFQSAERTPLVERITEEEIPSNTVTENVFKSINK